jgi:uncharacterized protein
MIKDVFVVDASAHSYNLREDNCAAGRYSRGVVEAFYGAHYGLSPVGYRLPREQFARDWTLAETAKVLFVESDYDFACHHVTPINAFKDGGCSIEKAREARERWPERFQVYAGVDPVFPEQALDSLEQQVEELKPVGIKLYPNSYTSDGVVGWHMDDPEIAFPIFQRAHDLGLKAVAIHKAIPLGPVPMDHYRMNDIDAAAAAFPDLQFEVVHGVSTGAISERLGEPRNHIEPCGRQTGCVREGHCRPHHTCRRRRARPAHVGVGCHCLTR